METANDVVNRVAVAGDLFEQRRKPGKADLISDARDELQANRPVILVQARDRRPDASVLSRVEQKGLKGSALAVERGFVADAGGGGECAGVGKMGNCGVDAIAGEQLRRIDIDGGVADRAPASFAGYDDAANFVRAREEGGGIAHAPV